MTDQSVETLQKRIETLEAQVAKLTSERDDAKKAANTARKAASAAKRQLPATPRKVGPLKDGNPTTAELREMLADADDVELVFSDGRSELKGIEPRTIAGDAWIDSLNGLKLNGVDLTVYGPGVGSTGGAHSLAGYGLLIDGKQVAWAERPAALTIGAGSTFNLSDDVIFAPPVEEPADV